MSRSSLTTKSSSTRRAAAALTAAITQHFRSHQPPAATGLTAGRPKSRSRKHRHCQLVPRRPDGTNTLFANYSMINANFYDLNCGDGQVSNFNSGDKGDDTLPEHVTPFMGAPAIFDGLSVVRVNTNGNSFLINNSNFLVGGDSMDDMFVFLIDEGEDFQASNARMLANQANTSNHILFLVPNGDNGSNIDFSNVEFFGTSFWALSMAGNGDYQGQVGWNNVRGCGQIVSGNLGNLNDFNVNTCAFVPVPATLSLGATGVGVLAVMGWVRRRYNKTDA